MNCKKEKQTKEKINMTTVAVVSTLHQIKIGKETVIFLFLSDATGSIGAPAKSIYEFLIKNKKFWEGKTKRKESYVV